MHTLDVVFKQSSPPPLPQAQKTHTQNKKKKKQQQIPNNAMPSQVLSYVLEKKKKIHVRV